MSLGYNLPARYLIHTVGPHLAAWAGGVKRPTAQQEQELADCYHACLYAAQEHGMRSLAFCCIATGIFAFPQERAAEIAVTTVCDLLKGLPQVERIIFNVFTNRDLAIYKTILAAL